MLAAFRVLKGHLLTCGKDLVHLTYLAFVMLAILFCPRWQVPDLYEKEATMTRFLPPDADLDYLKNHAKALRKAPMGAGICGKHRV